MLSSKTKHHLTLRRIVHPHLSALQHPDGRGISPHAVHARQCWRSLGIHLSRHEAAEEERRVCAQVQFRCFLFVV